jgi:quercetin dioxygenase-like cupin family protein
VSYRVLQSDEAFWRPSNLIGVMNTDLARQLGVDALGVRLWRLTPGQANTKHRHREQWEIYLLVEGQGRMRIDGDVVTLTPLSSVVVEPGSVRQVFNDTGADQLWLIVGAPAESQLTPEEYPEGPRVLPPELGGRAEQG